MTSIIFFSSDSGDVIDVIPSLLFRALTGLSTADLDFSIVLCLGEPSDLSGTLLRTDLGEFFNDEVASVDLVDLEEGVGEDCGDLVPFTLRLATGEERGELEGDFFVDFVTLRLATGDERGELEGDPFVGFLILPDERG